MTQEDTAARARIDAKHFQAIEGGWVNVTFATLLAIANALDCKPSDLV